MFEREVALEIKKMIDKEEVFLYQESVNHITKKEIVVYLYKNENVKTRHIEQMFKEGWIYNEDTKSREMLYGSIYHKDNVYVDCAYFSIIF